MQFAMHDTGWIGDVLEAYERLILDAMRGDHTLFTTAEGIERLWQVSEPLLDAPPPVRLYQPGSWGPKSIHQLVAPHAWRLPFERAWRDPEQHGHLDPMFSGWAGRPAPRHADIEGCAGCWPTPGLTTEGRGPGLSSRTSGPAGLLCLLMNARSGKRWRGCSPSGLTWVAFRYIFPADRRPTSRTNKNLEAALCLFGRTQATRLLTAG